MSIDQEPQERKLSIRRIERAEITGPLLDTALIHPRDQERNMQARRQAFRTAFARLGLNLGALTAADHVKLSLIRIPYMDQLAAGTESGNVIFNLVQVSDDVWEQILRTVTNRPGLNTENIAGLMHQLWIDDNQQSRAIFVRQSAHQKTMLHEGGHYLDLLSQERAGISGAVLSEVIAALSSYPTVETIVGAIELSHRYWQAYITDFMKQNPLSNYRGFLLQMGLQLESDDIITRNHLSLAATKIAETTYQLAQKYGTVGAAKLLHTRRTMQEALQLLDKDVAE